MQQINNPLVSVILPSYNHEKHVGIAIESVLNQTFCDYEFLVSDDHSTDGTLEIIQKYHDDRIQLHVFSENQGATINHKYLIDRAKGKYVALINSDDVWLPNKLKKQVAYLEAHEECGGCFSFAEIIDEDGSSINVYRDVFQKKNRTQAEWYRQFFLHGNCLCHPSMLIRTNIYHTLGVYNLSLRQLPDFDMWVRLIKHYGIYIFQEPLVQHRRFVSVSANTSAPTIRNSMRDAVESHYILNNYLNDVSDEFFSAAFRKEFRKADAITHNELCCEKFFLLLDGKFYLPQVSLLAAINYFFKIYSEEGMADTFRDSYNFRMADFHAISCEYDFLGIPPQNSNSDRYVDVELKTSPLTNVFKSIFQAIFGKRSKIYLWAKKTYYRTFHKTRF